MTSVETTFSTSIGDVQVDKDGIVIVTITTSNQSLETLKAHYTEYEKHLGSEKRKVILIFGIESIFLPADSRAYTNEKLNQLACTIAGVIDRPMIRIFVNIYVKMNRLQSNYNVFKDLESAKKWIKEI